MFISENTGILDEALQSGDQSNINRAIISFLKDMAAQLDTLRLDVDDSGAKTEAMVSNYEYINANMQVIKQAIVGDIKVDTAEELYGQPDEDLCCDDCEEGI